MVIVLIHVGVLSLKYKRWDLKHQCEIEIVSIR